MDTQLFFMALGLAFVLEGLMPALLPKQWKSFVEKLAQENINSVRQVGVVIILLGAIILWLAK